MKAEDHLRMAIGDLIFKLAHVSAENDALKAQLLTVQTELAAVPPPKKKAVS